MTTTSLPEAMVEQQQRRIAELMAKNIVEIGAAVERADVAVSALERIAYMRPSRVKPSKMIEQMERIALDAIAKVKP